MAAGLPEDIADSLLVILTSGAFSILRRELMEEGKIRRQASALEFSQDDPELS